ncbi:MAG: sodium-dependent transporter [bacterium]
MAEIKRERWGTRAGFILAAIGSAVGLGNMWRFPYLTAEYGGASFVFLYIVLLFLIGLPVMTAELTLGRGSRRSPVQALSQKGEQSWHWLGYLFVLTGFGILSYYSVIAGWTVRYMLDSLTGILMEVNTGEYFNSISEGQDALIYHLLFMAITTGIVLGGVRKGIERSVKLLIPTLFFLTFGLAIWAFYQPGSMEGYRFYLAPNWKNLLETYTLGGSSFSFLNLNMLAAAAGQTFFTLSLGMGAIITYASYLSEEEDLFGETLIISFSNFSISFIAGLMIFPIIFSTNLIDEIGDSTIGTLFVTLPEAFQKIGGWWGTILSFFFFFCLMLAALTSAISLLEVVTSTLIDEFNISRKNAAAGSGLAIFLGGVPAALSIGWLDLADRISGQFLLMVGGFFLTIYIGWVMKSALDELRRGMKFNAIPLWLFLIRYIVPPALLALLLTIGWELPEKIFNFLTGS